jgi:hypothetical protein
MLRDIALIFTAIGVVTGAASLLWARKQAQTGFEDSLAREYRDITRTLPIEARLGQPAPPSGSPEFLAYIDGFFRYIDLTNEQIFLRQVGRVSGRTWAFWWSGIEANLGVDGRPGFLAAWEYIRSESGEFDELARLLTENGSDPRHWRSPTNPDRA